MRITLHAVDAGDYPDLHTAMQRTLRAARLHDRRFKVTGLSAADADALIPDLLEFASPTPDQGRDRRPGSASGSALRRTRACGGRCGSSRRCTTPRPEARGRSAPRRRTSPRARHRPTEDDWDAALQVLVRRYLEGVRPRLGRDIAQFALSYKPPVRGGTARRSPTSSSVVEGPDGTELYDVPGGARPGRGHAGPAAAAGHVGQRPARLRRPQPGHPARLPHRWCIRRNGDVLPTLLVDGYVAGVWRPVDDGIEVTAFHPLADDDWAGLAAEARSLVAFLADRDPGGLRPLRATGGTSSRRVRCGCCPPGSSQTLEVRGGVTSNHPS